MYVVLQNTSKLNYIRKFMYIASKLNYIPKLMYVDAKNPGTKKF